MKFRHKDTNSMEAQVELAKTFIGKKTIINNGPSQFVPKFILVHIKGATLNGCGFSSKLTQDYLKNNDYCVTLHDNINACPVSMASLAPETKEIKLNDSYTAVVFPDKVNVGCQTFTHESIEKLWDAIKTIKK